MKPLHLREVCSRVETGTGSFSTWDVEALCWVLTQKIRERTVRHGADHILVTETVTALEPGPAPVLERGWPIGRLTSKIQNWNVPVVLFLLTNYVVLEEAGED